MNFVQELKWRGPRYNKGDMIKTFRIFSSCC